MSSDFSNLWQDLRRRRVFQVAAIYAAGAWVLVQVADVVGPTINMPNWVMTAIVGFAIVGFPIAVILAWLFDVGSKGVVRTKPGSVTGIFAIIVSVGLLVAGTAGFVWFIKPGESLQQVASDFSPVANSVAVMPFADLSPDKDSEHLSDGIAQVLIHQLSMIAKLKVIASESSFAFKGAETDIRTIAKKLRAERLLVGSVQRSGDRLRISTQLIDSRTGESVWSELFDRHGEDIFDIQDEIAMAIADKMDAALEPEVRDRATQPVTDDLDAYELYFLAIHELRTTPLDSGSHRAIELLEEAVARDPEFALAWAKLASTVYWHGQRGYLPDGEGLRLSREYVARALELDPKLSEAHSNAVLLQARDDDFDGARQSFEKAVEYGPSNWRAYLTFGLVLNAQGRYPEAVEVLLKGLERNSYRPEPWLRVNLGYAYIAMGDYEKGIRQYAANYAENRRSSLEGQYIAQLGQAALGAGRYDEALAVFEISLREGHDSARILAGMAFALLGIGDIDNATTVIARAESIVAEQRANGRTMNTTFANVTDTRWLLDIATKDFEHQLLMAKHFIKIADEGEQGLWSVNAFYDAAIRSLILGRHDDVVRMMDRYTIKSRDPENFAIAAYAHQKLGNSEKSEYYREEGRVVLDEFLTDRYPIAQDLLWVSLFQAVDERVDEAIEALQEIYELGFRDHAYLVYMPLFDSIRDDPRFSELLLNMRTDTAMMRERVDAARETGDWESIIERHFSD
jgi:TolB-like protein/tetratricopeptide (TPR) repeat protein